MYSKVQWIVSNKANCIKRQAQGRASQAPGYPQCVCSTVHWLRGLYYLILNLPVNDSQCRAKNMCCLLWRLDKYVLKSHMGSLNK